MTLKKGSKGKLVVQAQSDLRALGYKITVDGVFGPATEQVVRTFQRISGLPTSGVLDAGTAESIETALAAKKNKAPTRVYPKWYMEAQELIGHKETSPALAKILVPYWRTLYGLRYDSLIGSKRAWCGLFVGAALAMAGQQYAKRGAGAKNWAGYGQEIQYKKVGVPLGAIVHIDHDGDCRGDSNHVAFSAGNCAVKDFLDSNGKLKRGVTITLLGGNQQNKVNESRYDFKEVCAVRWPPGQPLPKLPITQSVNCAGGPATGGSTQ